MTIDTDMPVDDLCQAIARVEAAGYTCKREPMPDERLQNEWGSFLFAATRIEEFVKQGARLQGGRQLSYAVQIINRAVVAVERSAR